MKKIRVSMQVILSLLMAVVLFQVKGEYALASGLPTTGYKVVADGGTTNLSDKVYRMDEDVLNLEVVRTDGSPLSEIDVFWVTSANEVVSLTEGSVGIVDLARKGPGYSTVTATIKEKGLETVLATLKVHIKIDFSIDYTGLTLIDNKYLEMDTGNISEIKLVYADGNTVDRSNGKISFESLKPQIATVNSTTDKVRITAIGGGRTQILVTVAGLDGVTEAKDLVKEFNVIVKPSFELETLAYPSQSGVNVDIPDTPISQDVPLYEFFLKTNAASSSNLNWVIKEAYTGKIIDITSSDKMKVNIGVNQSVHISEIKAGTYDIYAFAADDTDTKSGFTYAFMRIVVPIMFHRTKSVSNSYDVVMSVNDFYNIIDNSNIPAIDIFEKDTYADAKKIIDFDTIKGEYKARVKGKTTVTLVYDDSIKELYDKALTIPDIDLNFTIIDDIVLDTASATLYEGSTIPIRAIVTNDNLTVKWESMDPSVAKVAADSDDPDNDRVRIITAGVADKEKGFSTTDIYASLVDDHGVIKKVKCTIIVRKPVVKIVLSKPTVKINVGDTESLSATIDPVELTNKTKIHWMSSDESIVSIKIFNDREIDITGIKAGHATISAIDQDNVVVGYSHVTVEEPVVGIELSSKDIEADLSTPFIQLVAIISPSIASDKSIQWKSTNTSVVDINNIGLVTIKSAGKASIIATSINNPLVSAICNITIHTPVMGLTMEKPDLTLKTGDSTQLTYILLPVDATNKSVAWSSSNPTIVDVDATGKVTAKSAGNAVIMLRSLDHGLTAYTTIKVTTGGSKVEDAGFKFDVEELEMDTGDKYEIKVTFEDKSMKVNDLRWASNNTGVVSVDHYGKLKANNPGVATVVATDEYGDRVYLKVTVVRPVDSILLNFTERAIKIGEKFNLDASVNPSDATRKKIEWVSSNPSVATITKNGLVEGLAGGVTTITAKIDGEEVTAKSIVTVNVDSTSIELNHSSYRLGLGERVNLKATVLPNFANQNVTWKSSDTRVATVNAQGRVVGISYGFATITATTKDGNEVETYAEIEVVRPVNRIHISSGSLSMMTGESAKLTAT
ncbi:MAG TPA: Ig domain-containing protein, partial [Clostridiales bacterium]|nr:Ig domain-containing protein [Clostridiales bacterium]